MIICKPQLQFVFLSDVIHLIIKGGIIIFKNFIRKRLIQKIAKCNKMITYYEQKVTSGILNIKNLEDSLHQYLSNGLFYSYYTNDYVISIEKHREKISSALGEIEYWQTILDSLAKQLETLE